MKEAIIILVGGVNKDGSLPDLPKRRVDGGVRLWKENPSAKVIMTGKYGFWLDWKKETPARSEAEAMNEYAESLGVPKEAIILETDSKDTIGNAHFTKINILQPNGWKNLIVVTSDFHLERTRYIFDLVLGDGYDIEYHGVPVIESKEEREQHIAQEEKTMQILKEMVGTIERGDMEGIKMLLFTKHPGYAENPEYSFERLREMLGRK